MMCDAVLVGRSDEHGRIKRSRLGLAKGVRLDPIEIYTSLVLVLPSTYVDIAAQSRFIQFLPV
eukprot:scaffold21727_cov115-Skeletonema_dohrnii-CCMP3373.AAC.2